MDLTKKGIAHENLFSCYIGAGVHTLLWNDIWLHDETLAYQFHTLYDIDKRKLTLVSERITINSFQGR